MANARMTCNRGTSSPSRRGLPALGVAAILVWRRMPFLVVLAAAATAATVRALGDRGACPERHAAVRPPRLTGAARV